MAGNQKKRLKKLEKKNAKRKQRTRELGKQKHRGLAERMTAAATAPVLECQAFKEIWDLGIGGVLLSRELPSGMIAFAVFLVDVYCLGVKDVFGDVVHKADYRSKIQEKWEDALPYEPAAARKLVEGAVDYARGIGLEPHPDYRKLKPIFGDIDAGECREEFEYGCDGKPRFVAGPHDSLPRCYQIMSILEHTCGKDGFHYVIPMRGDELADVELLEHDSEDD
jgi:hypothetical protein